MIDIRNKFSSIFMNDYQADATVSKINKLFVPLNIVNDLLLMYLTRTPSDDFKNNCFSGCVKRYKIVLFKLSGIHNFTI